MECRNTLSTCVPPSITNRNSLEPFVFSSEASRTGGIFTRLLGQKKLNERLEFSETTYESLTPILNSVYFYKSPRYLWSDHGHRVRCNYHIVALEGYGSNC